MRFFVIFSSLVVASTCAFAQTAPTMGPEANAKSDWYSVFTLPDQDNILGQNEAVSQALGIQNTSQTFKLYSSDKWMVNLDITTRPEQDTDSQIETRDQASAEAYYRLSPSWTVGGALSFGMNELNDPDAWENQRLQTGIRLESAFRF